MMVCLKVFRGKWRNACLVMVLVPVMVCFSSRRQMAVECFRFPNNNYPNHLINRRNVIAALTQFTSLMLLDPRIDQKDATALSLPFVNQEQDRRQKELCLVNLLRLQYWANSVVERLKTSDADDEESRKSIYLEARLGSKVIVAESKRISGGATVNVFMLKGLHLRECLDDLTYYADQSSKRKMDQYREDLIESLASIVEFDGLETTQDDSPRSSLTLSQYSSRKSIFVQRMLGERIIPLTDDILRLFGPETIAQTEYYMREFYPSEMKSTPSL